MSDREPPVSDVTAGDYTYPELSNVDDDSHALVDLVNRLLDKGVVIRGDVTISVAGVDLVYLGLNALLTSATTMRRHIDRSNEGRGV
jgi:gas vesicle structural protein